ncbi:MAG: ABC-three component system middle component 6 [Candidatus Adiutrix sp.]
MLLPDNVHPELSIYYNGALILHTLKKENKQPVVELFERIREESGMSFSVFVLSLDWLYLIDAAKVNTSGVVELCL